MTPSTRRHLRNLSGVLATLVTLAALAGCTLTTAAPEAAGRTAAPAGRQQFACPSAGSVAGLTALPFTSDAAASTCAYTADDSGAQATITIVRPAARGTTSLPTARARVKAGTVEAAAADLGFGAFTVRGPGGSCAAWVYAADGVVTRVVARHAGWNAARACGLARSAVTLMGVAPEPVVSAITAATLPTTSASPWTSRVAKDLGVQVWALPGSGSGYLAAAGGTASFAQQVTAVDPGSTAVVIVSGTSDAGAEPIVVLQAATKALAAARARAPRARLIVVGPVQAGSTPSSSVLTLRDDLHRAAAIARATFIDPIDEGWGSSAETTTKRLAASVARTLRAGSICPAVTGTAPAAACDAAKDSAGADDAVPAPDWTPATT